MRVLGGVAKGVAFNQRTDVLVAQNAEYLGQIARQRAAGSSLEIESNLLGNGQRQRRKVGKETA